MDICVFDPTAAGCQPEPQPEPTPMPMPDPNENMEGGDMDKDMDGKMMMGGMEGQITYTATAVMATTHIALTAFRYRPFATYYTEGDSLSFNYWKLYNQIEQYAGLAIFGVASITQILSLFGVAADVNVLVWWYGVHMTGMVVHLITAVLRFLAYETAWTACAGDSTTNPDQCATFDAVEHEMLELTAMATSMEFTLYTNHKSWMKAQWLAMDEETQAEWKEKMHGDKDGDKDGDMMMDM